MHDIYNLFLDVIMTYSDIQDVHVAIWHSVCFSERNWLSDNWTVHTKCKDSWTLSEQPVDILCTRILSIDIYLLVDTANILGMLYLLCYILSSRYKD